MCPFTGEQSCNGGMVGPPDFEGPGFPGTGQVKMSSRSWREQTDQTLVMKPRKVPRTSVLCLEEFKEFS